MKAKSLLEKIPVPRAGWRKILVNKYAFTLLAFLIWMIFFDQSRITRQWMLSATVSNLEQEREDYTHRIEQVKGDIYDLERNKEKFAREKYYLHQKGEEVFIMKDDNKKEKTKTQ